MAGFSQMENFPESEKHVKEILLGASLKGIFI